MHEQTITKSQTTRLMLLGYSFFILIGWSGLLVPSLVRTLEVQFHLSDAALAGFYLLSSLLYATGSLVGGFLTEKFGRKAVLIFASIALSIGLLGQGLVHTWTLFVTAAILANFGSGALDGGMNGLFLSLVSKDRRAGALNLLHLSFSIGAFTGPFLIGQMLTLGIDWQLIAVLFGIYAFLLSGIFSRQSVPNDHQVVQQTTEHIERRERTLLPFFCLATAICCYVAAEVGISNWLVKYLNEYPIGIATTALSLFWFGLALGRLISNWIANRFSATLFTICCLLLASSMLFSAVAVSSVLLRLLFFSLTGFFSGPIYPMIMVVGSHFYPNRLSRLSGSLGAAGIAGSVIYPPLMGIMATTIGLHTAMIGAGLLCIPAAGALLFAEFATKPT